MLQNILSAIQAIGKLVPVALAVLAGPAAFFVWLFNGGGIETLNTRVVEMTGYVESVAPSLQKTMPMAASVWNNVAYFIPVNFLSSILLVVLFVRFVAAIIRIIKSFIPTVA